MKKTSNINNNVLVGIMFLLSILYVKETSAQTVITLSQPETGTGVIEHIAQEKIDMIPNYEFNATTTDNMHAFINPALPVATNYTGGNSNTDLDNRVLNTDFAVGATAGNHSVSASGGAIYSIPIAIPQGTAGMQPNIALSYNSQSGEGIAGYGWNIAGLSSITRVSKTQYDDGYTEGVSLTSADDYALDGNRFKLNGTSPVVTLNNASHKITPHGNIGGSPEWFMAEASNGWILEFGRTTDSRFMSNNISPATPIFWNINKIYDQYGNYIEFKYNNSGRHPRIEKILYTGNSNAGLAPYNEINFYYNNKSGNEQYNNYIAGASIKSHYILRKIAVESHNNTFREYELDYTQNFYSQLKSVKEKGFGGEELNSTLFKYGDDTPQVELGVTNALPANITAGGDFNQDGLSDIMLSNSTNWAAYVSDGNNNFAPYVAGVLPIGNWKVETFAGDLSQNLTVPGTSFDFNGDGISDILLSGISSINSNLVLNQIRVEQVNGYNNTTPYILFNGNALISNNGKYMYPGDFDGDGKDEIIVFIRSAFPLTSPYYAILVEYGNGGIITTPIIDNSDLRFAPFAEKIHVVDFDGDGKSELMVVHSGAGGVCSIMELNTSSGTPVSNSIFFSANPGYPTSFHTIYPGDFNGDAKTDIVTYVNGIWQVGYSTGKTFLVQPITFAVYTAAELDQFRIGDFNGDGKMDFFNNRFTGTSTFNEVFYSTGSGFIQEPHVLATPSGNNYVVGDYNGDGKMDMLNQVVVGLPNTIYSFHKTGQELLLDKISDGMSNTVDFDYLPLTNNTVYTKSVSETYPNRTIKPAMNVVREVSTNDGIGGGNYFRYKYSNATVNIHGKGFLGFTNTVIRGSKTSNGTITSIHTTHRGLSSVVPQLLTLSKSFYASNILTIREIYDTEIIKNLSTGTIWSRTNSVSTVDLLRNNFTTTKNYTWNNNLRTIEKEEVIKGNIETVTTDYGYSTINGFGDWNKIKLNDQTITTVRSGEPSYIRSIDYQYNPQGTLIQEITDAGNPLAITSDYQNINSFGLTQQIVVSASGATRTSTLQYDNNGRFVIKETNTIGQEAITNYNEVLGLPKKTIGIDGLVTTYDYDGFGRLNRTITPDGIENKTKLNWDFSESLSLYNQLEETTGNPTVKTIYDKLGRVLKTERDGFNQKIYTATTYDEFGNIKTTTSPYFLQDQPVITTYNYNNLSFKNRLTSTATPDVTITYTHQFNSGNQTITTQSPNGSTSKIIDPTGLVVQSADDGGVIVFSYHSSGLSKQTTLGGNIVAKMEYDLLGNKTLLEDPNSGVTTYTSDAFGQLLFQKDGKNNEFTLTYDDLGRVVTSSDNNNGIAAYSYVLNGNGINQPEEITYNNITQKLTYDYLGRLIENFELVGAKEFKYNYEYDNLGRINATTYPSGFKIKQHYNNFGYPITITDDATNLAIWTAGSLNANDQYLSYTYGNGLTTTKTYNQYGMPISFQSSDASVQDLLFDFDVENGNLLSRINSTSILMEDFTYDPTLHKNRLIEAKVNGLMQTNTAYQNNGNILNKTDAGLYTYDQTKKNAVIKVTNPSNIISNNIQDITYTTFNSVNTITEDNKELIFTYGADKQRRKTEFLNNGVLEKTTYYQGNYEEVENANGDITKIHYIAAGSGLAAIHVVKEPNGQNATENMYYAQTDYLGSILTLTNEQGLRVFEQNFDAWGRMRNVDDWSFVNTSPFVKVGEDFSWLNRGYTGHEHLPQFGLINMNGRMYDPISARMLSPDNFVQSPLNTQSYNRYSYVFNNPLKYTDPDGEFPFIALGVLVAFNYLQGVKANDWNFNPFNWGSTNEAGETIYYSFGIGTNSQGGLSSLSAGIGTNPNSVSTFNFNASGGIASINWGDVDFWRFKGEATTPTTGLYGEPFIPIIYKPRFDRLDAVNGIDYESVSLSLAGSAASFGQNIYYNENTGIWTDRNFKIRSTNVNGNGSTGGKLKFGSKVSSYFKIAGRGLGAYNLYGIANKAASGEMDKVEAVIEFSSGLYSTFGAYGGAWGLGWELGRGITKIPGYGEYIRTPYLQHIGSTYLGRKYYSPPPQNSECKICPLYND
jgi:RHS repeat-associated protein